MNTKHEPLHLNSFHGSQWRHGDTTLPGKISISKVPVFNDHLRKFFNIWLTTLGRQTNPEIGLLQRNAYDLESLLIKTRNEIGTLVKIVLSIRVVSWILHLLIREMQQPQTLMGLIFDTPVTSFKIKRMQ